MIKLKHLIITILCAMSLELYSCDENDTPQEPRETTRTILVYMVANNSLGVSNFDSNDLQEMVEAANNDLFNNGRLLVYHAPTNQNPTLVEIAKDKITTLKQYDQSLLSVSSQRMQQVINDVKSIAPALDYGLVLWSHANGWLQTGIESNTILSVAKNISPVTFTMQPMAFGEDQGKSMNITTLAEVVDDEGFSFIYFDCCYMATIEVVYQLRNATPYIIASAPEIPANGMPYEQNLPLLFADVPKLQEACINTFDYYNSQNGLLRSCAISLIDTKYIEELAQVTSVIYEMKNSLPEDFEPQKFTLDSKCYYFDFGQYVTALSQDNLQLLSQWNEALNKVVIYKASTPRMWNQLKLDWHSGLSTYILENATDFTTKGYDQLQWWKDVAYKQWAD